MATLFQSLPLLFILSVQLINLKSFCDIFSVLLDPVFLIHNLISVTSKDRSFGFNTNFARTIASGKNDKDCINREFSWTTDDNIAPR